MEYQNYALYSKIFKMLCFGIPLDGAFLRQRSFFKKSITKGHLLSCMVQRKHRQHFFRKEWREKL